MHAQRTVWTTQLSKFNTVIGVVLVELHVVVRVHVPLVDVCDAVIDLTLVLIALVVIVVFVVAIFRRILLYWRKTVYTHCVVPEVAP